MRALLLHVNKFRADVTAPSNWPAGINPEKRQKAFEDMRDCIVAFFCVEKTDSQKQLTALYKEIIKTAKEVKTNKILISPFVHISRNIAEPAIAKKFYEQLMKKFEQTKYELKSSHFGYHKTLLLDVKGHPGSFRYREFY